MKRDRIQTEHPKQSLFTIKQNSQALLSNTIGTCQYKEDGIINCISFIDGDYIMYGISSNNFKNEMTTIFKPSIRQLVKCKDSVIFFDNNFKIDFERHII